ncbi:MAG: hypothetical protein QXL27_09805 [Candidatus Bathyarchaeia archaeon]
MESVKKYPKTNLFVIDENLWKWAKYRASILGYKSVSEYVFELIKKDKESTEASRK